jgi:hypothetical protein
MDKKTQIMETIKAVANWAAMRSPGTTLKATQVQAKVGGLSPLMVMAVEEVVVLMLA